MKYVIFAICVVVVGLSGALAGTPGLSRMMARGCMSMMQSMYGDAYQRPNEQWRGQ